MKINNLFNTIESKITQSQIARKEAKISKYIQIHDATTYGDSFQKMYNAREILANYAKEKGVTIDIYDARKIIEDDIITPANENNLTDKINIIVTNLLTGKSKSKIISANTDKVHKRTTQSSDVLSIPSEDVIIVRNKIKENEDNFLRNLYRNIENLTNIVTGKKSK